jgi:hypothetical protein
MDFVPLADLEIRKALALMILNYDSVILLRILEA